MTTLDRVLIRVGVAALAVIALYLLVAVAIDVALWRRDVTVAVQQLINAANRPAATAPSPAPPAVPAPAPKVVR